MFNGPIHRRSHRVKCLMPNYAHTHWQGRSDYFSAFSSFFVFSLSLEYPSTVDIRLMQQSDRESVAWKNETNSNE